MDFLILFFKFLFDLILDYRDIKIFGHDCVASLLLKRLILAEASTDFKVEMGITVILISFFFFRAFYKFEFEDVRKLVAELCGRIHPQVYNSDFILFYLLITIPGSLQENLMSLLLAFYLLNLLLFFTDESIFFLCF